MQTAISIRHSDSVDVKFLLSDGEAETQKTISMQHRDLLELSRSTGRPMTDPWCSRLAMLHLRYLVESGEDMEKPLVYVSPKELAAYDERQAGYKDAGPLAARGHDPETGALLGRVAEAHRAFKARFGLPGRVRCRVIRAMNSARDVVDRLLRRPKFFWRIDYFCKPYPPGIPPPLVPGQPVCPLSGRAPDRLLFSTRDTRFGDTRINYVYYNTSERLALAYPPMQRKELDELYEWHYWEPCSEMVLPDPGCHTPYRGYRGGSLLARNLHRLPSPWWFFHKLAYDDPTASALLRAVKGRAAGQ